MRNVLGWLSVSFYFTFARENKRNFSHLRQAKDEECISGKEGRVDVLAHRHLIVEYVNIASKMCSFS